jgi:hypothetical protein
VGEINAPEQSPFFLMEQGYRHTVSRMKTTVDLPKELVLEAKKAALARNLTLKTLVERGLLREIQNPSPPSLTPLQALRELNPSVWSGITADAYVEELRKEWR